MEKIKWPSWPQYGEEEYLAVERVIKSNQLYADVEVKKFEEHYAEYLNCKFAIGLGNATQGLHLALVALDIGVGDEVIVTPYSWISSASCILMQNAVPVFCDIENESFGLDPKEVEKKITKRTKAIIVVHMFGYPAKIIEIAAIAQKYGIPLIEDASHAHGLKVDGVSVGTFGQISVFSLHQRKALSVGDGGIVCTNTEKINNKIKKLRSFGHEELSYNYRMTEFAGSLGLIGLRKLDEQNNIRRENANLLAELLSDQTNIKVLLGRKNEDPVFYAVLIEIIADYTNLDSRLSHLQSLGIPIRKTWEPLHTHPHFNPDSVPARGLPWQHPDYDGEMKGKMYSELDLPITNEFCPHKLLELYVYPPTGAKEVNYAVKNIKLVLGENF
ncbi:MAG: DegT/DnrJ/EryC1/StrS family aminotransferase [Chlorobium sp.]|nr:DegT/DnrJ/EryC1/StrS family aminotransferase [Chlorobium sp.]